MDINTILGGASLTAIRVQGLYVRARDIGRFLEAHCEPALFHSTGEEIYSLAKSGSAFRVRIENRYFCITTWHQLRKSQFGFEQFCLFNSERKLLVTSESATFFQRQEDEDLKNDFLMFEFTSPVHEGSLPRHNWYDLADELKRELTPKPALTLAIGFPGQMNEIDYDRMSYASQAYAVYGREARSLIEGRLAFSPDPKISFNPSGMSGGPVFGISIDSTGPNLFFAGIISEATSSKFNFVPLSRLSNAITKSLARP